MMPKSELMLLGDLENKADNSCDLTAYTQVVRDYSASMVVYCTRHFPDRINLSDAEDLEQQVLMELFETVEKGIKNGQVPVRGWLFQRLHHRCLNFVYRKCCCNDDSKCSSCASMDSMADLHLLPWEDVDDDERRQFISETIHKRLKGKTRDIINLLYLEGLSQTEIATRLGISKSRVTQLKRHGIQLLRKWFRTLGYFDNS